MPQVVSGVYGIGMGFCFTPLMIAVQDSVVFEERGVATATTMFFRSIGGTLGVGVTGTIIARELMASSFARDAGGAEFVARILGPDRKNIESSVLEIVSSDLERGLAQVSWIWLGLGVVGVIASLFFPNPGLRTLKTHASSTDA